MELSFWQLWRTRAYLFMIGVKRHVTLGTRVAVIRDGKVFLVRQTYLPGWHMPGGGVEPGESVESSAARELREETGLQPTSPMALQGLFLVVNRTTNRDYIALYICRDFEAAAAFRTNMEIAAGEWFPLDALPADATGPTKRRITEIWTGSAADPLW